MLTNGGTRRSDVLPTFSKAIAPQWLTASADLYDHVATGADEDIADPGQAHSDGDVVTPAALPEGGVPLALQDLVD
jgi:hypothetical protein